MNPSEPDSQGQDCLESEQVLTHPSLEVCSYELPTLKAGMVGQTEVVGGGNGNAGDGTGEDIGGCCGVKRHSCCWGG